jgi:murein DD-endopeptidase MepM/ murein hydrolase activator NlpD
MTDFLRDLLARPGAARTVILLEPDTMSAPRQYEVRPGYALYGAVIAVVVVAAVLVAAAVLTPLRGALVGPGADVLRAAAERNAARAVALEDSVTAQYEQIAQLRAIITGETDSTGSPALDPGAPGAGAASPSAPEPGAGPAGRPSAGTAPTASAPGIARTPTSRTPRDAEPVRLVGPTAAYLAALRAPALPPLDGVVSRGFSPGRGHYGLDLAADRGTPVRSVGDGTVVFADWTQDGGLTVAVQHPGGYLSIYKHNGRLGRRVGDRVRARETVALSGNTGEISSGPHLHVEVWRDGRAQDPATFFLLR